MASTSVPVHTATPLSVELPGHGLEQHAVQAAADQLAAEADEGGALRGRLVRSKAAETTKAATALQRLSEVHIRQVVPGGQQQRLEERQRPSSPFAAAEMSACG